MSTLTLEAQPRDVHAVKPRHLRRDGRVPVIVYGRSQTPVSLTVEERGLDSTLRHGGSSRLIEVQVVGGPSHNVLVREVQRDPVSHRLLHADFYAVNMKEKQHVSIPVVGHGKPLALGSGLMVLQNHEMILIEALPADIPATIEVDLTHLSVDTPVKTTDLPKVKGVAYLTDPDEHIFSMVATQAGIEEEAAAAEETSAEPEVVKRGKEDEE
jgi:large subunit ribosomal protein L25